MPSRRQFLGATATGAVVATAGCLGSFETGDDGPTTDESPTTSATTSAALSPGEQIQGEAESISTTETVTDDQYEYVEANDTVRYPATMSGGEVASYGYSTFEEWTEVEGASAGSLAVLDRLESRLESTASISAGIGTPDVADGLAVTVSYETLKNREGEVIEEPDVPVRRVVAETPHSFEATVEFAGRSETHSYPVFVWKTVLQQE